MKIPPERITHYSRLGVNPGDPPRQIERAYWKLRRKGEREGAGDGELRGIDEAYSVLSNPQRRKSYDRLLGTASHPAWDETMPEAAKAAFRRCLRLLERDQYGRALVQARRAVRLDPGRGLYRSYFALLTARSGGCLREAAREGDLAYRREPGSRRVALNLVALYEMAGMPRRAMELRRKAERGLLSRIFRRS